MIVEFVGDVLKLSGDLVTNQWETVRTAAGLLLKKHPQGIVVDCSGLRKVTEEGAQTFYDMMVYIQSKKARIIVAAVPEHVRKVISHVPDIRSELAIAGTVAEARHSLDLLQEIREEKTKKKHTTGTLLLSLCGSGADSHAIALAACIAEMRLLSVEAVYALIVPRALPLDTPRSEEEAKAARILQQAVDILSRKGLEVNPVVERGRNVASTLEKVCKECNSIVTILSLPPPDPRTGEPQATIEEVLERLPSEVILIREPKK